MDDIWEFIKRKTNNDCTYIIKKEYYRLIHKDKLKYCLCQVIDIIIEQRYQIWGYENGVINLKPKYILYKYILEQNRYKIILNKKIIMKNIGIIR